MRIGRAALGRLVPHQGAMCLLEEVIEADADAIVCRAVSHRDPGNPLRSEGRLAAVIGVEYAAQAVAVHGGMANADFAKGGMLAAVRDVACAVERLDTEHGDLVVSARRLAAEGARLLYDFRIEGGGRELVKGRLSVVLVDEKSPGHGR